MNRLDASYGSLESRVARLLASRAGLAAAGDPPRRPLEAEGGCGVLGLASSAPIAGRHLLRPMRQMGNRGNGKGGGIAAVGLDPAQFGVDPATMTHCHLVQIACLDAGARGEVEKGFLEPAYEIVHASRAACLDDFRQLRGLAVEPPQVWRYFARPRPASVARFAEENQLEDGDVSDVADEFVYQTSYRVNESFYASLGTKRAFVLSHGKDMLVLKLVGFAEQAIEYYRLEEMTAHVWIGHQRYPTKGRVWHPGGAHPFVGLHEALVHNGDFANYASISEYLAQRNLRPLFLTDTEVAVLLFDLWSRVYRYPMEYVIEAMAPTTERDFDLLPEAKRRVYRALQAAHIHGSPDGPWFFIVARNDARAGAYQLLGITDTSMLRPQVFALHEGEVQIGLIASERQAIDALLEDVAADDDRVSPVADVYWNARGGSHTDGGAFVFSVKKTPALDGARLECTDKFGGIVKAPERPHAPRRGQVAARSSERSRALAQLVLGTGDEGALESSESDAVAAAALGPIASAGYDELTAFLESVRAALPALASPALEAARTRLTLLLDRLCGRARVRPSWLTAALERLLDGLFDRIASIERANGASAVRIEWGSIAALRGPHAPGDTLVVDAAGFPPDGPRSAGRLLAEALALGWRRFVVYRTRGHRFLGCGLGPETGGVTVDVYGRSGDYLGSGLDGAAVTVHGAGQDQLGQILKGGRLVVHGDVGQAFLYGAKGGDVFVRGNAAGRPLINAVGSPRVVINGTCLDYLAESFMAGDPLNGGGYAVLNAMRFDDSGRLEPLERPYPGSNLFSLASGGALYVRDPHGLLVEGQLNGGRFSVLSPRDWALVEPLLRENERVFGIPLESLLSVDGRHLPADRVYRKIEPIRLRALEGV